MNNTKIFTYKKTFFFFTILTLYFIYPQLDHIDTKGQLISIIGFMAVSWSDWRLAWNKTEFGDLDHIALHPTDVWLPSFVMGNTAAPHLFKLEWYTVNKVQVRFYV